MPSPAAASTDDVREYWNRHIHDLEITTHPVGSPGFFADLDQYHFEKLHHLLRLINFDGYAGKRVLEVGCGAGTDLARFARGGAIVSGVDLSSSAIRLAQQNFEQQRLQGDLREADGERLPFADDTFDLVYAHGVVQYTANPQRLVDEWCESSKSDFPSSRGCTADGRVRSSTRSLSARSTHCRDRWSDVLDGTFWRSAANEANHDRQSSRVWK
ncbi:MAG: methyltransferase domain-containing protein [Acidobacteria bacterium]|nr:methyltransferase domain-containing protein [Acidobacteriota bacterium]